MCVSSSYNRKIIPFTMSSFCPQKFQFANEFGFLRKEAVISTMDVRNIVKTVDNACGLDTMVQKLVLCENISKSCQKGLTTTLVDPETNSQVVFPSGTAIVQWAVVNKTCGNLPCELSFMLGYLSDCLENDSRQAVLAQRVAGVDAQITAAPLNYFHKAFLNDQLTATRLASLKALYDAEDADNGECVENMDLGFVTGDNSVAEPKALMPAITVTSGELCVGDLEFYIQYIPPCPGTQCRPVVVCEPCSPRGCNRNGCNSPRGYRRGCR